MWCNENPSDEFIYNFGTAVGYVVSVSLIYQLPNHVRFNVFVRNNQKYDMYIIYLLLIIVLIFLYNSDSCLRSVRLASRRAKQSAIRVSFVSRTKEILGVLPVMEAALCQCPRTKFWYKPQNRLKQIFLYISIKKESSMLFIRFIFLFFFIH